jgi:hypothetical protein
MYMEAACESVGACAPMAVPAYGSFVVVALVPSPPYILCKEGVFFLLTTYAKKVLRKVSMMQEPSPSVHTENIINSRPTIIWAKHQGSSNS